MAEYTLQLTRTASATLGVGAYQCTATLRRTRLHGFTLGSHATPADNAFRWLIERVSTAVTGDSVTPQKCDPADGDAAFDAAENLTANGTTGSDLRNVPLNQRVTFRWEAPPFKGFYTPATDNNGIIFQTPTSTAVAVYADLDIEEL
jgi:hypothetical protein